MTTCRLLKAAWIRKPGYPVGQPAPGYWHCPCGAKPDAPGYGDDVAPVTCSCGRVYDGNGYIQETESLRAVEG